METLALFEARQPVAKINANPQKLKTNDDGFIDLYVAPKAPLAWNRTRTGLHPAGPGSSVFRRSGSMEAYDDKSQ